MQVECVPCNTRFDTETRLPTTGTCEHVICNPCRKASPNQACPICQLQGAFAKMKMHQDIYDHIEEMGDAVNPEPEPDQEDVSSGDASKEDEKLSSRCQLIVDRICETLDCTNRDTLAILSLLYAIDEEHAGWKRMEDVMECDDEAFTKEATQILEDYKYNVHEKSRKTREDQLLPKKSSATTSPYFDAAASMLATAGKCGLNPYLTTMVLETAVVKASPRLTEFVPRLSAIAPVTLTVVTLAPFIVYDIYKFYKGELSGKQLATRTVGKVAGAGAGFLGAAGGAAAGVAIAGPVGGVVGAIVVSLAAGLIADRCATWLMEYFFSRSPSEAVVNAYKLMGVEPNVSNICVNSAFEDLMKKYNPDMPEGDEDMFLRVQVAMTLIQAHRGQPPKDKNL